MQVKPAALKKNDRIGLVSPGTRPGSPAVMSYAVRVIEEMGFAPVPGKNALNIHGHLAGTDAERLADINGFIEDESIAAIMCVTGGFGALPLISQINYDALKTHPKIIAGSDENTALLQAVQKMAGLSVLLAPNLDRVKNQQSFESLKHAMTSSSPIRLECEKTNVSSTVSISNSFSSFEGKVAGRVIGGNLSALLSLMGTPYQPVFDNVILYLDDYNERFDILDRWFTTLVISGELQKTAGVVFGDFNACGSRGNTSILPLEDLFGERLRELSKPNMFGLTTGHNNGSATIPLGIEGQFDSKTALFEFSTAAVS